MRTKRRSPNAPAGWHEFWAARLVGALCRSRPDLPWTGIEVDEKETKPGFAEVAAMRDVCYSCPVRLACGEYALDPRLPAQGGMYATVWIPWQPANGATEPSNRTQGWLNARRELERLIGYWKHRHLAELRRTGAVRAQERRARRNLSLTNEGA